MNGEIWPKLDQWLRSCLAELPAKQFETFFLLFLTAGVSLTVQHHGRRLTRRVNSARIYSGDGKDQEGIDLEADVGGVERWCFQCKRRKQWNRSQTIEAIRKAERHQAHHYFLAVACNPGPDVHAEMLNHPNWTLWNLETICSEFWLRVPPTNQAKCLAGFVDPAMLKRFVPFSTEALVSPQEFFSRFLGSQKLFRHDWKLVGREDAMKALDDFVRSDQPKVLELVSKGGDGKSRLLWEFMRDIQTRMPGAQALFLNPHSRDEPAFAFLGDATRRVVVIDDAHRVELVPLELLSLVRKDPAAKLVLATRPQGVEALAPKLFEVGLYDSYRVLPLKKLNKADTKALAVEALGEKLACHAQTLADFTTDSPFLTVLAGEFLRQGTLSLNQLAGHAEFQQHVLRAFEAENLRNIAEADKTLAQGLLRIVAMLAPLPMGADFAEKAARCVGSSVLTVETQLRRLRAAELIVGREDGLRIVPDLFADFLVYDTCYAPTSKMPAFAKQVITEFVDSGPAALRNLAEAAWVAQANGIPDDTLVQPLVDEEMRRFAAGSFVERAAILEHWQTFGVYLPRESLALARVAMTLKPPPNRRTESVLGDEMEYSEDAHAAVFAELPPLLQPIAQYHDAHRELALNILWELGLRREWPASSEGREHPWSAIAEVMSYRCNKPPAVTISTLHWLGRLLLNPNALQALEKSASILRILLQSCFEPVVRCTEFDGRSLRLWHLPVLIQDTEPIRERALAIITHVIERGSPMAALNAVSALEKAIEPARPKRGVTLEDGFVAAWNKERSKALACLELILVRHSQVALRYAVWRTLKTQLAFEKNETLQTAFRRVLAGITEDLSLRVAITIMPNALMETDESEGTIEERSQRSHAVRYQRLRMTAQELRRTHPAPDTLFSFLQELDRELDFAGHRPWFGPLLDELAKTDPALAAGLGEQILKADAPPCLIHEVPRLVWGNAAFVESQRSELLAKLTRSSVPGAAASTAAFVSRQIQQAKRVATDVEAGLLLELAAMPDPGVASKLLEFCQTAEGPTLTLAGRILETIPLARLSPDVVAGVWGVLVPFRRGSAPLPANVLDHMFRQLVEVPQLDLHQHWEQFAELTKTMPRAVYSLLRERIIYSTTTKAPQGYLSKPVNYDFTLQLPGLTAQPDYAAICDELWRRVLNRQESRRDQWVALWQAVVLSDDEAWLSRIQHEIGAAQSADALVALVDLIRFNGSLVIFRYPDLARAFITRAQTLGGNELVASVRANLATGCGPMIRGYTNGVLDEKYDYVEAEAMKAAEQQAADPVLGPFYRWIVEVEQRDRLGHKAKSDAEMAAWD